MAHSSLRFGIGRFTTEAEIDFVVEKIVATVNKLREMRLAFSFSHLQQKTYCVI
jgi:cysteine sulfinate desulfinase/cysteine desulfurase-like protein